MKETQEKLKRRRKERQRKQENFTNNKKLEFKNEIGITLIALVVTIVVLLILAGITINMLFSNGGIFKTAEDAADAWNEAVINEQESLDNIADQIDNLVNGTGTPTEPVTNPYDPDGWVMAWTCTDGTWSDTINSGEPAEGDIVAKLYTTGSKITPTPVYATGLLGMPTLTEGDEYKLVIEGQGDMPLVANLDNTTAVAWQTQTLAFMTGTSQTCIMPYVTEVIICDGITNIGDGAFGVGSSLSNVTIANSVTSIESNAFVLCENLSSITLPNNITNIGDSAFSLCVALTSISLPDSVTNIGQGAFSLCANLSNITLPNGITTIGDMFE